MKEYYDIETSNRAMLVAFSFQTAVYLGDQRVGRFAGFIGGLALIASPQF